MQKIYIILLVTVLVLHKEMADWKQCQLCVRVRVRVCVNILVYLHRRVRQIAFEGQREVCSELAEVLLRSEKAYHWNYAGASLHISPGK